MTVSSVTTNTYTADIIGENSNNDPNITDYNNLSSTWNNTYSSNVYLSNDFKEEMKKKLDELKNLVNLSEEEKKNEEIAKSIGNLIASLKIIINGNNSMLGLADRVSCLEEISKYENYLIDTGTNLYDTLYEKLNNINSTYKDTKTFYNDLFVEILEAKKVQLSSSDYNTIKDNISNEKYSSTDTSKEFIQDLSQGVISYSVYKNEQDNISSAARSNLSNQTISMKVMQESNAYKLLEIDNIVSEALSKRAEMDPAMKRLRDGVYWGDNKEIKPQESIKPEDELWTKKQE